MKLADILSVDRVELRHALDGRVGQFGMRVGMAAGAALGMAPVVGWTAGFWLLAVLAIQLIERTWVLGAGGPDRPLPGVLWGIPLIAVSNLVFAFIGVAGVFAGGVWPIVCGVMILVGVLMNAGPSSGCSRAAFIAAVTPLGLYALLIPVRAHALGASAAELWQVSACVVMLFGATFSLRKFALRAIMAERQANAAKNNFLAVVSHEIRTPLNGVLGMAQLMARDELSPAQADRLEKLHQSGEGLLAMLNDLLDLSKIEAGKLELCIEEFALTPFLSAVEDAFAALAAQRGLEFDVQVEAGAADVYLGDSSRIRQILYNLISNALKFTAAGRVQLGVSAVENGLCFVVKDTGIGINPDALSRLFNKFEQEDATTTRRFGGTGLGLAICRELATAMGGEISAASTRDVGSEFTVWLPVRKIRAETAPAPAEKGATDDALGEELRILVAEDNATNRTILQLLLEQVGIFPTFACDGQEALDLWSAQSYDLVLMDVQMPVMDGVTAVRAMREIERASSRPRTPVIALTANVMAHQRQDYVLAGMDDCVAKPIRLPELVGSIQTCLSRPAMASVA